MFGSDHGLELHVARNVAKPCGLFAASAKRSIRKAWFDERKRAIKSTNMRHLWKKLSIKNNRVRGAPLRTEDKEAILRIFDQNMTFFGQNIVKKSKVIFNLLSYELQCSETQRSDTRRSDTLTL